MSWGAGRKGGGGGGWGRGWDIVQFQKKSIPTPWKVIENCKGGTGVFKVKILEAKYEGKLEFPGGGGGGAKQTTFCKGSLDIFWNCILPYIAYMEMCNGTQKAVHF